MNEQQNKKYPTGTEVTSSFKLTEEVFVGVDFTLTEDLTREQLDKECRNRLERAGLPRDLEEVNL